MKKLVLSCLLLWNIPVGLGSIVFSAPPGTGEPKISISPEISDFGIINTGEKATRTFKIRNSGNEVLEIKRIKTSCKCLVASISEKKIPPGKESEIKAIFDSKGYKNTVVNYIYVDSNDPVQPYKTLTIIGNIVTTPAGRTKQQISTHSAVNAKYISIRMYFFYSKDCKECIDIKENYIPKIKKKYPANIEIKYLEMNKPENYKLMLELEQKYREVKNPPPAIFIDNYLLDGEKEILKKLEKIVKDCLLKGGCDWPYLPAGKTIKQAKIDLQTVVQKFKYLGVAAVIVGGLIDGINPCAFGTLIIFVIYLTYVGRKRREILQVGLVFALAVFIAYFSIGIGLSEFIGRITFLPVINRIILFSAAVIAILFGILSLYDYYKIREGKLKEITLQLPQIFKDKIKTLIWKKSSVKHYLISAFVIGFLVALLEFPCTGQIYFPIVVVLRNVPHLRLHSLFYLALYNFMFIVPLLLVFVFVYMGTATETKLSNFLQKHAGKVKIFMAILFFLIAAIIMGTLLDN